MVVTERKLTFKNASITIKKRAYGTVEVLVEDKGDGDVNIREVKVDGVRVEDANDVIAEAGFDFTEGEWDTDVFIRCGEDLDIDDVVGGKKNEHRR